jgi:prepilin-type N-terminal cleavage/methylation domain-containing protein
MPDHHNKNDGFALIEVMIVIGILAVIINLGIFLSLDFYRTYTFNADIDVVASIIHKARMRAVNNINQAKHGVHYDSGNHELIIFEGTHNPSDPTNEKISLSQRLGVTWPADVVFNQNSGNSDNQTVIVSDGVKVVTITINEEGGINY